MYIVNKRYILVIPLFVVLIFVISKENYKKYMDYFLARTGLFLKALTVKIFRTHSMNNLILACRKKEERAYL